jgi:outer membrane receptor protein involved in Fe transport
VIVPVDYTVRTFYVRAGYTIPTSVGSFPPYVFVDWMDHPEVIASKGYGGDNESGVADNGKFWKPSVGVVYKPHESVAIKLDSSAQIQKFNGKTEYYPEVRLDISFAFKMFDKIF